MKRSKLFLITLVLLIFSPCVAQISPDALLKFPQDTIAAYGTEGMVGNAVVLEMDFGSTTIKNKEELKKLEGKFIYQIDLVYTAYHQSETFEQPKLNKKRLAELKKVFPDAFTNYYTGWRFVAQTAAKDEGAAKKMFHGVVIYYLDRMPMTTEEELANMDDLLNNDSLGRVKMEVKEKIKIKKHKEYTGKFWPKSKTKRKKGIVYDKKGWGRKRHYNLIPDTIRSYDTTMVYEPGKYADSYISNRFDSTVFNAFERNKNWKNILVVCDVTGSMSPYSVQVLAWHKLNFNAGNTVGYVFFNDGNETPDEKKVIGKTGGIYFANGDQINGVEDTAKRAMMMGSGGDAPENNIEALLAAIEKYPKCQEVVMIADNWADIKDFKLAYKIKKPVRIILCGVQGGMINPQYLDFARMTKGSVHTLETDLTNLMKLNEGQSITLDGITYTVQKGKFVPTKRL
jgi:hypothetical protein